ncbi:MAG: transport-associated protein [uncultured bacterium]|nr:MAG: transport-associated protein [uncultured bacterium]
MTPQLALVLEAEKLGSLLERVEVYWVVMNYPFFNPFNRLLRHDIEQLTQLKSKVMKLRLYMKTKFLPVLVLLFLTSCASTPVKRNLSEVIDDSVISNRLKVRYIKDTLVKGFDINIDTYKGIVSLKGQLEDQSQINRAIEIAERENGVKEVKSYLYIDPAQNKEYVSEQKGYKQKIKSVGNKLLGNSEGKKSGIQESTITN